MYTLSHGSQTLDSIRISLREIRLIKTMSTRTFKALVYPGVIINPMAFIENHLPICQGGYLKMIPSKAITCPNVNLIIISLSQALISVEKYALSRCPGVSFAQSQQLRFATHKLQSRCLDVCWMSFREWLAPPPRSQFDTNKMEVFQASSPLINRKSCDTLILILSQHAT